MRKEDTRKLFKIKTEARCENPQRVLMEFIRILRTCSYTKFFETIRIVDQF